MFIGRKNELRVLEKQYISDKFEFTVLYGRRRIGKTHLLRKFIEHKQAIYYMALESSATSNLELLSTAVHIQSSNDNTLATFASYEKLFQHLSMLAKNERLIFIIDEFPYLAQAVPEISSLIQKFADHDWQETKLQLILCGSSMSFMENQVLGAKSPLYGRRTAQIKLKEFTYFETAEFLHKMSKKDVAVLHCATGGVAEYLTHVNQKANLRSNLVSLFLEESGRLYEEPMNFLKQELREPRVYNDILDAIASGASKNNEIADKTHRQTGALNRYLDSLIELGIIIRETPIGKSNRKTIYRIRNGAFRFWYRYVHPNMSAIELGLGESVFDTIIADDLNNFMGEGFEQIFFDYFDRMNQEMSLPELVLERGRWWGNNPKLKREEEIDLVGIGKTTTFFAEVKWTTKKINRQVIEGLIDKSLCIDSTNRYYLLFSKNGFTSDATEYATAVENIMLLQF